MENTTVDIGLIGKESGRSCSLKKWRQSKDSQNMKIKVLPLKTIGTYSGASF